MKNFKLVKSNKTDTRKAYTLYYIISYTILYYIILYYIILYCAMSEDNLILQILIAISFLQNINFCTFLYILFYVNSLLLVLV